MTKRKPNSQISAEDSALFRAAMANTKPLLRSGKLRTEDSLNPAIPASRSVSTLKTPLKAKPKARLAKTLEVGAATDLDRRTMERLRKGRLRPEARIDLHGLTASHAYKALCDFLYRAHGLNQRCVLIITGKGLSKKGGGVIRRELSTWLNAPSNRPLVLGFAQAQPYDGGGGAFYVLLKRQR